LLKKILIAFAVLVGLLSLGSYLIPAKWQFKQSVIVNATADRIFPFVTDLKKWNEWNAFALLDPDTKFSYSGSATGVGSVSAWVSPQMGSGSQTIIRAEPAEGVEFDLLFEGKYAMQGKITFTAAEGGTRVTWTSWGENGMNPLHRWMSLVGGKMMNEGFFKSLMTLKAKVESELPAAP